MPRDIGLLMCCYGQPKLMAMQKAAWDGYPKEFQERLQIIVIDDCGDPAFTCEEETPYELIILRVDKNIPWNQPGAKNLGFRESTVNWIINMDPDMVFTNLAVEQILQQMPDVLRRGSKYHYKFGLDHTNGHKTMDYGSPNFYMVHKDEFWRCGGYNEDFAGHKGYSDVTLHRTLYFSRGGKTRVFWKIAANFVNTNDVEDAAVMSLDRSVKFNHKRFAAAVDLAKRHSWMHYADSFRKNGYVRFPWSKIR